MKSIVSRMMVMLVLSPVLMAASCTTSSQTSAQNDELIKSARGIVGTSLIGAKGATPADDRKIGRSVARKCSTGVWTKAECATHQMEVDS